MKHEPAAHPRRRGRLLGLLAAVPLAIGAILAFAAPAQAEVGIVQPITNDGNHKCLDVRTQDNMTVQLWHCSGAREQLWSYGGGRTVGGLTYYQIIGDSTDKCLTIAADSTLPTSSAIVVTCNAGDPSQFWAPSGILDFASLRNQRSGLFLDLRGNSSADGTIIQQNTPTGTTSEEWVRANNWGP